MTQPAPANIQYVIKYTLDGQRRWDFAVLSEPSMAEAEAALRKLHGEDAALITDVRISKAL